MEMQRRPLPERFLVVEVDSTEELPSEPDPGSAGSSLAFGMSRHPSPSAGHLQSSPRATPASQPIVGCSRRENGVAARAHGDSF